MVCSAAETSIETSPQAPARPVAHEQDVLGRGVEVELGDVGAGVELAHLWMDDVVQGQHQGSGAGVALAEVPLDLGEDGKGLAAEPPHHGIGRRVQGLRGGGHEPHEVLVGVAAERRVGAVQPGAVKDVVPGVLPVISGHELLEGVEGEALHARGLSGRGWSSPAGAARQEDR